MERRELIERLVPLIPPPRAHQARYHGILAPCASQRDWVVPAGRPPCELRRPINAESLERRDERMPLATPEPGKLEALSQRDDETSAARLHREPSTAPVANGQSDREEPPRPIGAADNAGRMQWAALLQRVFEVDALRCPRCGSTMRLVAAIEDPNVARRILRSLNLPPRAPPLLPALAEAASLDTTQDGWFFDQSPAHEEP